MAMTSLRGRLLVWYTTLLGAVIVVFGAMVCYLAWRDAVGDLDAALRRHAEALAQGLQPADAGTFDLVLPRGAAANPDVYHAVWTAAGVSIDRSGVEFDIPIPSAPGARTRDGRRELAARTPSGAIVLVGTSLDPARADLLRLAATMGAVGVVALAVSLLGGWVLAGRALRPIDRIGKTARAMSDGDFTARIPIDRVETELGQLASALNRAFERLHASLERQRRFTANASHELRTPLTTLSTELQWALMRERTATDYRGSLDVCGRAVGRMQSIVERLLALARAESTEVPPRTVPTRLDELAAGVAEDLRPLATARCVDVVVSAQPVTCVGDPDALRDAVANVVMNGIQYNVEGGRLRVDVREAAEFAEVTVADTGVGIAPHHLGQVFEPFFRADPARSRDAGGAGLGLALARTIARRHGGDVTCDSEPGRGTTCTIRVARRSPA